MSSSTDGCTVMSFIPLSEWCSVDLNDRRFGEGVGSNEFVVGRVVGYDDDTDLASDTLRAPGEVAGFETKCTEFAVASTSSDKMDTLGSDTGIRWLTTLFKGTVERQMLGDRYSRRSSVKVCTYRFLR